jgi:hypothetical protein
MTRKTNAQAAAAIFRTPPADVSALNFHVYNTNNYAAHGVVACGVPTAGFTRVVDVASYSTCIASVVHNANTGKRELWTTTCRYSPTTDKHMRLVWRAYHAAIAAGEDIAHFSFDMERYLSRVWLGQLSPRGGYHYTRVMAHLQRVVARGVHATTRRSAYQQALAMVRSGLDTTTRDAPMAEVLACNPPGYEAHLQWAKDIEDTLLAWVDLSDADLRVAVAGYLALAEGEKS